ncbi:MAG: nucleotidyltransferase domain-containing protein [Candidatus Woesearchaeota archaeon]|nr:nucleotidyltransferase domain-containing protein [Candidatus Woesearchaeota archaeon]
MRLLIENRDKELSISQIAHLLKKDYKNAHNMVSRLSKIPVVGIQPFGRSHRVVLIQKMHPIIFEAEFLRRAELLKNKDLAIMLDSFSKLRTKMHVLLVFGSYAKGTQTKKSDIDLLFVVPDDSEERLQKEIQNIARTLPLPLHINIFKETDFIAMKDSKKITVGSEAMKKNIILQGIEPYYELIQ